MAPTVPAKPATPIAAPPGSDCSSQKPLPSRPEEFGLTESYLAILYNALRGAGYAGAGITAFLSVRDIITFFRDLDDLKMGASSSVGDWNPINTFGATAPGLGAPAATTGAHAHYRGATQSVGGIVPPYSPSLFGATQSVGGIVPPYSPSLFGATQSVGAPDISPPTPVTPSGDASAADAADATIAATEGLGAANKMRWLTAQTEKVDRSKNAMLNSLGWMGLSLGVGASAAGLESFLNSEQNYKIGLNGAGTYQPQSEMSVGSRKEKI